MRSKILINKALGRQAKIFFIDAENIPALIASAILGVLIGPLLSNDIFVPVLLFISFFAAWTVVTQNKPREFMAKLHRDKPPSWVRGRTIYANPLKKGKTLR
jgi:hypothetical protein